MQQIQILTEIQKSSAHYILKGKDCHFSYYSGTI